MKVHGVASSLQTVLEHRRGRALFVEHLRRAGHGAEFKLLFHEAVSQYLQLAPSGFQAAARAVAEGIVVEYVPDYAMTRISLPANLRHELLHALKEGRVDRYPALLKRAREEVYAEMGREHLRAFTASEPFALMLQALSSGNDLAELRSELSDVSA